MKHHQNLICPNCEIEFSDNYQYCPHCGQKNKKLNLSFSYFISEFLSANFNIDSKIYITFKLLLFSPAKLTKEFFEGRRTKYLPPVRVYLLVSLLYFTVLSFTLNKDKDIVKFNDSSTNTVLTDSIGMSSVSRNLINDSIVPDTTDALEKSIVGKLKILKTKNGKQIFLQKIQRFASVGMFILIPLMALIFFALFFRGTFYIQHLVFSIHLQSVVFILFLFFNIVEYYIDYKIVTIIEVLMFITIIFSWIKMYYNNGIGKTIWKTIAFFVLYMIVLILFIITILGFSFYSL